MALWQNVEGFFPNPFKDIHYEYPSLKSFEGIL